MTRALVLGGGGVTGIAWETGVLLGLRDNGVDLVGADLTVGTSAGAAVAAQVLSGVDLEELYARQLSPGHHEIPAELDLELLMKIFGDLMDGPIDTTKLQRVGELALAADTVPEGERRAVIEHRLPNHEWPTDPLRVTAVDAHTGAFEVFDATSGMSLVDAVAASCAVPGVWPPVTIGSRRFMDGGVRSTVNVDLAANYDEVVVVAPLSGPAAEMARQEIAALPATTTVRVIATDDDALAAMGPNALDPAMRPPAAEAGRRQGRDAAPLF